MELLTREEYGLAYDIGFGRTVGFLLSRGLSRDDATEKAQEAWARGWERRHQIRDRSKTAIWINTIALNIHRSHARRPAPLSLDREPHESPRVNLARILARQILGRCRDRDRAILVDHYLLENGIGELASRYGCTETTVRVRLMRARRRALSQTLPQALPHPCPSPSAVLMSPRGGLSRGKPSCSATR
jgi:DNA-directed RNA polymerase specialized sigma24 family protein